MPNLNVDMKSTADFAVKSARERFQLDLDYSDESITKLDNIVTQIYWGFTSRDKNSKDSLIYNTALIWGSYLGEYMRQKWGGTWVLKGSDPTISIKNIEFAPIALIYNKITDHPEYSLESFLKEAGKRIPPRVLNPEPIPPPPVEIIQPKKVVSVKELRPPIKIDKRLFIALAGLVGVLFIFLTLLFGYRMIRSGGLSAFGLFPPNSSPSVVPFVATITNTPTPFDTSTPFYTPTLLPTYTPKPTLTLLPSRTPLPTSTPTVITSTPTNTPTNTPLPTRRVRTPTSTHIPATEVAPASATPLPGPTNTSPPPPSLTSCEINPSSVPAGSSSSLTFIAHFNYPGYQFSIAEFQPGLPGQSGCTGSLSDGGGTSQCTGSSGIMPGGTGVSVRFTSSAGDCTAGYSSP